MYLLDTNVVSELRKARPHGAVLEWIRGIEDKDLHLAAVTLGEIQAGIEITRRQDPPKAAEIEAWADLVAETYNILPLDAAAFRTWAKLMHGGRDSLYEDAMIAAVARNHGLTVVTRNLGDFSTFGVPLFDPFTGRHHAQAPR